MSERTEGRPQRRVDSARAKDAQVRREWLADFEAAERRSLELRLRYAFFGTYKPVLDDAPYRAFETTEQYRQWCEANVPSWLGYGPAGD